MALVLGALLLSGCASKKDPDFARRLTPSEASKLIEKQAARQQTWGGDLKAADPVHLEKHGDALAAQGDPIAAVFQYTRALILVPEGQKTRLYAKIGRLYLMGRQFPQAEDMYLRLTQAQPRNATAWQGLGLARLGLNENDKAEKALKRALELNPKLWKSLNGLGILYNREDQPDKAEAVLIRALAQKPNAAALHNNLGMVYMLKRDYPRAEESFREAIRLNPDYRLAANNLGMAYAQQRRFDEARRAFEMGVGRPQAHNNVGCFLAWNGKYPRAVEEFRQALNAKPSYYSRAGRNLKQLQSYAGTLAPTEVAPSKGWTGDKAPVQEKPPVIKTVTIGSSQPLAVTAAARIPTAGKPEKAEAHRLPSRFGWGGSDVGFNVNKPGLGD
jgi:tetratricopeptide (TPR) repeat protein